MEPTIDRSLAERASPQLGLITRHQLRQIGLHPPAVRHRVASGRLEPIGTRTFRVGGTPDSFPQRVLAACLDTGGVASHRTAAALHGLHGFETPRHVEVLVVHGRRSHRSALATVHTTTYLPADDVHLVAQVPCTSVARTILGLAALVPEIGAETLANAIDVAVRDGKATDRWLWWRLERLRRQGRTGVSAMETLMAARAGGAVAESWLERETLRVLAEGGLPLPICQQRIQASGAFVARVDFFYPGHLLVIEVKGQRSHSTVAERKADAERENALKLAGFRVLSFTYEHVVQESGYMCGVIATTLGLRAAA